MKDQGTTAAADTNAGLCLGQLRQPVSLPPGSPTICGGTTHTLSTPFLTAAMGTAAGPGAILQAGQAAEAQAARWARSLAALLRLPPGKRSGMRLDQEAGGGRREAYKAGHPAGERPGGRGRVRAWACGTGTACWNRFPGRRRSWKRRKICRSCRTRRSQEERTASSAHTCTHAGEGWGTRACPPRAAGTGVRRSAARGGAGAGRRGLQRLCTYLGAVAWAAPPRLPQDGGVHVLGDALYAQAGDCTGADGGPGGGAACGPHAACCATSSSSSNRWWQAPGLAAARRSRAGRGAACRCAAGGGHPPRLLPLYRAGSTLTNSSAVVSTHTSPILGGSGGTLPGQGDRSGGMLLGSAVGQAG